MNPLPKYNEKGELDTRLRVDPVTGDVGIGTPKGEHMTDEEIHNIYLHMSGKAEGLVEANGTADFPVLFARAILEYDRLTKDAQNMASKSTYKEQLETKDEPVALVAEVHISRYTIEWTNGPLQEGTKLYTTPQRTWVKLTDEEIETIYAECNVWDKFEYERMLEAKLKERNT